jgi:hypothetical protein
MFAQKSEGRTVSKFRIKPLNEQRRQAMSREKQRARFRGVQAFGLLVVAALVLLYRLLHTPEGWLFPRGWWRW